MGAIEALVDALLEEYPRLADKEWMSADGPTPIKEMNFQHAVNAEAYALNRIVGYWLTRSGLPVTLAPQVFRATGMGHAFRKRIAKGPTPRKTPDPAAQFEKVAYIGRLFWDKDREYPSPWVPFRTISEYRQWGRDLRKVRPGTKTECIYVSPGWTAAGLLEHSKKGAR